MFLCSIVCFVLLRRNNKYSTRSCHDLIILLLGLPVRRYALNLYSNCGWESQESSSYVQPIAIGYILHLTVDGWLYTDRVFVAHTTTTIIGSGCAKVM